MNLHGDTSVALTLCAPCLPCLRTFCPLPHSLVYVTARFVYRLHVRLPPDIAVALDAEDGDPTESGQRSISVGATPVPLAPDRITFDGNPQQLCLEVQHIVEDGGPVFACLVAGA